VARKTRLFHDNVSEYITPSDFAKQRLAAAGLPERRISVVPSMLRAPESAVDPSANQYAAYMGRIVPEKGVSTFVEAARLSGLDVRIGGDASLMPELAASAPASVRFLGRLTNEEVEGLYRGARFLVVPSVWYETFGLVAAEAMSHGVPVIASKIGALEEVVDDGVTGLLFEPGNAEDLAAKMRLLWNDPALCRRMGEAGRQKVIKEYNEGAHYERLMAVYEAALRTSRELPRV